jgi:hypothetical protein
MGCTVLQDLPNTGGRLVVFRISFVSRDEGFVVGGSRFGACFVDFLFLAVLLSFETQSCRRCVVSWKQLLSWCFRGHVKWWSVNEELGVCCFTLCSVSSSTVVRSVRPRMNEIYLLAKFVWDWIYWYFDEFCYSSAPAVRRDVTLFCVQRQRRTLQPAEHVRMLCATLSVNVWFF